MNAILTKKILSLYKDLSLIEKFHIYARLRRIPFERIEEFVPKAGKILDFGCGHGFFCLYLENKSRQRQIVGTEISEKKIKVAIKSSHSLRTVFLCDKDGKLTNKPNFYDCIIALDVLYLLKVNQQKAIIGKFFSCLKKRGKLILFEPNADLKLPMLSLKLREFIMVKTLRLTSGETISFRSKTWWQKALNDYFSDVKILNFGKKDFYQLYVCTK